jgi:SAM-dependent methyltransferase
MRAVIETGAVYGSALSRTYSRHLHVSGECEQNVNDWLCRTLARLVPGQDVLDAGCGSGRWLAELEKSGARTYVGVDASRSMLRQIPGAEIIRWPALGEHLFTSRPTFIEGHLQQVLPELGPVATVVLSSFNVVCFDDPIVPLTAIRACLQEGGALVCVTNVFVPASLAPDASRCEQSVGVDLSRVAEEPPVASRLLFRHVLHLPSGTVPLQDHLHRLDEFAGALRVGWRVESAELFSAQGCMLVDPDEPGAVALFSGFEDPGGRLFRPGSDGELVYAKLCFVARKISSV